MKAMLTFIVVVCLSFTGMAFNGNKQEIKGRIVDKVTNQPLEGVNICFYQAGVPVGTITDENGEFHLWDFSANVSLKISLEGYQDKVIENPLEELKGGAPIAIQVIDSVKIKKKAVIKNMKQVKQLSVFASE